MSELMYLTLTPDAVTRIFVPSSEYVETLGGETAEDNFQRLVSIILKPFIEGKCAEVDLIEEEDAKWQDEWDNWVDLAREVS